jgi:Tfp pilus assembly protein PilF
MQGGTVMSETLNISEALLARGRRVLDLGRDGEARPLFARVVGYNESPATTLEATLHLAEIAIRQRRFAAARRHLGRVLAARPTCPQCHFLMATVLYQQGGRRLRRAAHYYRQAVRFAPHEAAFQADYGQCLLSLGLRRAGLKRLARAVRLAPQDVEFVRTLTMELLTLGKLRKARQVAQAALFRRPNDPDFRQLWDAVRFHAARRGQQRWNLTVSLVPFELPELLPFPTASKAAAPAPRAVLTFPRTLPFPTAETGRARRRQSS